MNSFRGLCLSVNDAPGWENHLAGQLGIARQQLDLYLGGKVVPPYAVIMGVRSIALQRMSYVSAYLAQFDHSYGTLSSIPYAGTA